MIDGCPCPACEQGLSRAYLHYLLRARELTAVRLVTLHNLVFVAEVVRSLRASIEQGRLAEAAAALRAGDRPTWCTD